jgi:hypothetical protein
MDGRMRAVQTNEQQMEQTEPRADAERPPKMPPGQAIAQKETALLAGQAD